MNYRLNSFLKVIILSVIPWAALWPTHSMAVTDFGHGRPVTYQDLSGKKYCWSNGNLALYGADGKFSNNRGAHDTPWSVPEPGVLKVGHRYRQVEVLPDGQLHSYHYCLYCTADHDFDFWAKQCD
jgi:hypothetical protein